MKEKIRNILIMIFFFTGIPFLRYFFLKKKFKTLLRVVVFHEIKSEHVRNFQKKIVWLKNKFNLISPRDFLNKNFSKIKINILLTFDDGFESWLENVIPFLKKEKISAIFFLDKRRINLAQKLAETGFEIGSHTLSHPRLPELPLDDINKELKESKKILEQKTDKKIIFFAYPFGDIKSFNKEVIRATKEAGYKYAFTILPGFNTENTNPFLLHRDGLNVSWSNFLTLAWLLGSYDLLKKIADFFKNSY